MRTRSCDAIPRKGGIHLSVALDLCPGELIVGGATFGVIRAKLFIDRGSGTEKFVGFAPMARGVEAIHQCNERIDIAGNIMEAQTGLGGGSLDVTGFGQP